MKQYRLMLVTVALVMTSLSLLGCQDATKSALSIAENTNEYTKGQGFNQAVHSQLKYFHLSVAAKNRQALPINQFHQWIVTLNDVNQTPITDAAFFISGGMKGHGHGLPTQPKVTKHLGNGRYLLEGMKFNMDGKWFVRIQISTPKQQDIAEFSFNVHY
ncbi:hypothetical protein DXX93_16710 [Thalassotalea euphylliae]|uniref:YtkA-like domain-containing protein n=1 Tax=Thalassotalea euphylliae TaxID=1655234 RepID=A0A3E0TU88_9GAMM|nr:FixH family protein [Thalassotalea euphylliae]REL28039.1 hypothetical protein DXX93_16710 [Thalassotalea euphylliae]